MSATQTKKSGKGAVVNASQSNREEFLAPGWRVECRQDGGMRLVKKATYVGNDDKRSSSPTQKMSFIRRLFG